MTKWRENEGGFAAAMANKTWSYMQLPDLTCACCCAHKLSQVTRIILKGETDETCLCATYEVKA